MSILIIRVLLIAVFLYLAFRLVRGLVARSKADSVDIDNNAAPLDEDTLLTGFLRLQVVREKDAKSLTKQRVFFDAYGFG